MISAKTRYETDNDKLFIIVETLKTYGHYFESYKHEILIITNYNSPCRFIDTKSLSF